MGASRVYNRRTKHEPFAGYSGPIVKYPLRHEAATGWAAGILPALFVSALDFASGHWTAALPEGTPEDVANGFTQGILPEPPVSVWKAFDAEHVGAGMSERIASSLGCTVSELVVVPKGSLVLFAAQSVVEHLGTTSSALALICEMNPQSTAGAVVWTTALGALYPVSGPRARDDVADLIDLATDASGSGLLVLTSSERHDPSTAAALLDDEMVELLARADAIILGAYDGETHVQWSRTRTE